MILKMKKMKKPKKFSVSIKNKEDLETNKNKEDSKDLYSSGETESQADDVKSSNVTDFVKLEHNLIALQVSS